MRGPYYTGSAIAGPQAPVEVVVRDRRDPGEAQPYEADEGLAAAVNVALMLGQPLLLTGEPGTGKTQLAYHVAVELGWGKPEKFSTKSASSYRDLFYLFDHLRRFHAAHAEGMSRDNFDYITFEALGKAILNSLEPDAVRALLPRYAHPGRRQTIVLVDEIDKAPRDFPNDLLHEFETLRFRIPELNNIEIQADQARRPVLVLASNSEKNLPDAFLRRCIFYNIPFPTPVRMAAILLRHFPEFERADEPLLASAVKFFYELRELGLTKPPSTAELLNWVQVLRKREAPPDRDLTESKSAVFGTLGTLSKSVEDAEKIEGYARKTKILPEAPPDPSRQPDRS